MRLKPIHQQTVVITGASSGIGLATARALAATGAAVVVAARNEAALRQLVKAITAQGGKAAYVVADVGREEDVRRIADTAMTYFGGFDTWFNNAGTAILGKTEDVSLADHRRLFDTNYWGVVYGSLVALPHLRARGGALINMGSILCDRAIPLQGPYSASKHAIKAITATLRMELEREGAPVSVTLIKPATVATPLLDHMTNYLPREPLLPPPAYEPAAVVRAVRFAAEHPVRDLIVGDIGPFASLADSLAPQLTDKLMEATLFDLQQSDAPEGGRHPNLHQPSTGGSERGNYPLALPDSVYTRTTTSRVVSTAISLGGRMTAAVSVLAGIAARMAAVGRRR